MESTYMGCKIIYRGAGFVTALYQYNINEIINGIPVIVIRNGEFKGHEKDVKAEIRRYKKNGWLA